MLRHSFTAASLKNCQVSVVLVSKVHPVLFDVLVDARTNGHWVAAAVWNAVRLEQSAIQFPVQRPKQGIMSRRGRGMDIPPLERSRAEQAGTGFAEQEA